MASDLKSRRMQIITLGDHMVGKTSLLKRFRDGSFSYLTSTTIGIDFVTKELLIPGTSDKVSVKIWDTAGQDRFHTITQSFYKQCQGVLLVFDVGSKKSFENVHKWMSNIKSYADPGIIKCLLGNKVDCATREVSTQEALQLAQEHGMSYFETSALLNKNVTEAIQGLARSIHSRTAKGPPAAGFALTVTVKEASQASCCGG